MKNNILYVTLFLLMILFAGCGGEMGGDIQSSFGGDNGVPLLSTVSLLTIDEGDNFEFTLGAADPDGDTLNFSCVKNCPQGLSINSETGAVTINAGYGEAGTYNVVFQVNDKSSYCRATMSLTINNVPHFQGWIGRKSSDGLATPGWITGDTGKTGEGDGMFENPHAMALDEDGYLYVADRYNHRIQKFDPAGIFMGWIGRKSSDGLPTDGWFTGDTSCYGNADGTFDCPRGVFVDGNGKIYVSENCNHRVQVFNADGTFSFKLGGSGVGDGEFNTTRDVTLDSSGNIYVNDGGARVQKFNSSGTFLGWIGGIDTLEITNGWDIGGASAIGSGDGMFSRIIDVAFDSSGNIYATDNYNYRVQKFNSAGIFQGWLGKKLSDGTPSNAWITGDQGAQGPEDGAFCGPHGIFVDTSDSDKIYVADYCGGMIKVINNDGSFNFSFNNDGNMYEPREVVVDSAGNIYVSERYRVTKFDSSGVFLGWIGRKLSDGNFTGGWIAGDSPQSGSGDGALYYAIGLKIDEASDKLFVGDMGNYRVQVFTLSTGAYEDQFSTGGQTEYIEIDGAGNIYVSYYSYIKVFDSLYNVVTMYGSSGSGDGEFYSALGIAISGGAMIVADYGSYSGSGNRIQKWTTAGVFQGWIGKKASTTPTNGWHVGDSSSAGTIEGTLISPIGLAIDESRDRLYVSDEGGNTSYVHVFQLSTGNFLSRFSETGHNLGQIGLDPSGNIYVPISCCSFIWVYEPEAFALTDTLSASGTGDGEIYGPLEVTFHGYDMFIVDSSNHRIQKW